MYLQSKQISKEIRYANCYMYKMMYTDSVNDEYDDINLVNSMIKSTRVLAWKPIS